MGGKPSWALTLVDWEIKKVIWRYWFLGFTLHRTKEIFKDKNSPYPEYAPVSVDTVKKVRQELSRMPVELLDKLIAEEPELEPFVTEKRPDYLEERPSRYLPPSPHTIELSSTAMSIAKNLDNYRKESSACIGSPHCVGVWVYGEDCVGSDYTTLDRIDREKAADLLSHIRDEFPELQGLTKKEEPKEWKDIYDDDVTADFVNRLELKAHEGKFKGRCPHCPE